MYLISILIAKTTNLIIKLLKAGSGYTWPGTIVLKIFPNIWYKLPLPENIILITGTNGKTTTTKLITHFLENSNSRVLSNKTGANLLNGILTTLLLGATWKGTLTYDYIILEVDEFTLPELLKYIKPKVVALLNLSRDQLDRHWETDVVFEKWVTAINLLNACTLVLDSNQLEFQNFTTQLADPSKFNIIYFDDAFTVDMLAGSHNQKNVNCALAVLHTFRYAREKILESFKSFTYAFGRGESISYNKQNFTVFLAKNPASMNYNLTSLISLPLFDSLLFVLNDNIPDGHDVSWIYDIDPILLKSACVGKTVFVSGSRAYDMAIRLSYAGITVFAVEIGLSAILKRVGQHPNSKEILVLPNYSAMLTFRELTTGRKIL